MLQFEKSWRFTSPSSLEEDVVDEFYSLTLKISSSRFSKKGILEKFKRNFAPVSGREFSESTSVAWAQSDLRRFMADASTNAPMFIEAFYETCVEICHLDPDAAVPDIRIINEVLSQNSVNYEVDPPRLIARRLNAISVMLPRSKSLSESAHETIRESLERVDNFLNQQRYRQAVQEALWILETITTAYNGLDNEKMQIKGGYFSAIVKEVRKHQKGQPIEQAFGWMSTLHGYLSSPTGGRVRHGSEIESHVELSRSDAVLYCNLIRSYATYLIEEYDKIVRK